LFPRIDVMSDELFGRATQSRPQEFFRFTRHAKIRGKLSHQMSIQFKAETSPTVFLAVSMFFLPSRRSKSVASFGSMSVSVTHNYFSDCAAQPLTTQRPLRLG